MVDKKEKSLESANRQGALALLNIFNNNPDEAAAAALVIYKLAQAAAGTAPEF